MNPFLDIWDSFKTGTSGLSGRKLAAFWSITIVATVLSYVLAYIVLKQPVREFVYLLYIIYAWLTFGAICLGLVTIPELIKFLAELKNGKSNTTTTEPDNKDSV